MVKDLNAESPNNLKSVNIKKIRDVNIKLECTTILNCLHHNNTGFYIFFYFRTFSLTQKSYKKNKPTSL